MSADCPGPGWARVVLDEADANDVAATLTIDDLRARVHADMEAGFYAATGSLGLRFEVRAVALARAQALIDERMDAWKQTVRRLKGTNSPLH